MYLKQWSDKKQLNNYPTNQIAVKIYSRKLHLIKEKFNEIYPHGAMAIKY